VLVVHGIGEQAPGATLDRVCRGLRSVLDDRVVQMTHTSRFLDDRVTSGVRFELDTALPRSKATRLDVFEGYWAPQSANLLSVRGVAGWLRHTLLSPFRNWARIRLDDVSLGRRLEIVLGELIAAIATFAMVAGMLVATVYYLDVGLIDIIRDLDFGPLFLVQLAAGGAALAFLAIAVRGTVFTHVGPTITALRRLYVTRMLREPFATKDHDLIEVEAGAGSRRTWARTGWVGFAPLALVVVLIQIRADAETPPAQVAGDRARIDSLRDMLDDDRLIWGVVLTALWLTIARLLRTIGADIAVYVAENDDSAAGMLRSHILTSIVGQLRELLQSGRYGTVHLVGHSLGSLISYDALNVLRVEVEHREHWAGSADEQHYTLLRADAYDRFGSLVTIACPLDTIDYAFRSVASDTQPIRDQIHSRRHGLRRVGARHGAGAYRFDENFRSGVRRGYYPREPARFAWLNVNASPDPVGTPLRQYLPDERRVVRFAPLALSAHTKVMSDRRTYYAMLAYL